MTRISNAHAWTAVGLPRLLGVLISLCLVIQSGTAARLNGLERLVYDSFETQFGKKSPGHKKQPQLASSSVPVAASPLFTFTKLFSRNAKVSNNHISEYDTKQHTKLARLQPQQSGFKLQPRKALQWKAFSSQARERFLSFVKGGLAFHSKKKVLILMSDTGGGHRASAQAIDQSLREQFPGRFDVEIMDIWTDHANWPYNRFVPVYRYLAKHPVLWSGFFAYGTFSVTKKLTEIASWRSSYDRFRKAIETSNPDFVVSVHPLCQLMPISIVQEMNKKRSEEKPPIPFVTVVTDLGGAHCTWFDQRADALYIPSEAVRKLAIRNGIKTDKILVKGLPIRPAFWKDAKPKLVVRKLLGIRPRDKTVLLMGGGDGVGGLGNIAIEVAKKLAQLQFTSQLVVICGHNKKTADMLRRSLPGTEKDKIAIKGFVNNIDEYMAASDCLITKAGPGTIAEAMTRGLPLILSSYLPGQEYGNVPYVVDGGFGIYTGNQPRKIADTIGALVSDDKRLAKMSRNARSMSHPEATIAIAHDIGDTLLHLKPAKHFYSQPTC